MKEEPFSFRLFRSEVAGCSKSKVFSGSDEGNSSFVLEIERVGKLGMGIVVDDDQFPICRCGGEKGANQCTREIVRSEVDGNDREGHGNVRIIIPETKKKARWIAPAGP